MEIWRIGSDTAARPKVISTHNLAVALVCHFAAFVLFWLYSVCHGLFESHDEPKIEFFDPTVVVVENLNGNEDEPPPLKKVEPEPPPPPPPPTPKPKPRPKKEEPKQLEKMMTNVVKKVDKKVEKKEPEKKEAKKEPEQPKKTAKELREERMKKMRESAKQVNRTTVVERQPNGRTDKKTLSDAEIQKLLNAGYRPGKSTNLAANEEQLGYSLIKQAFEAKWDKPPWTDTMKPMVIRVWFGNGGKIVNYKLESSSGDARADQSIKSAASRVGSVPVLPAGFIDKYRSKGVPVRFTVTPN